MTLLPPLQSLSVWVVIPALGAIRYGLHSPPSRTAFWKHSMPQPTPVMQVAKPFRRSALADAEARYKREDGVDM
jgi:hypothetical protein